MNNSGKNENEMMQNSEWQKTVLKMRWQIINALKSISEVKVAALVYRFEWERGRMNSILGWL